MATYEPVMNANGAAIARRESMFASSNQLSPQHQHQASATKQNDQENKRRHSEDLRSSSSEDTADSATEHDLASSRASLGGCPVMHKVTTVDKEDDPLANSLEGSMNYLFEQLQRSKENDGRHEDDDDDDSQSHGTAGSSTIINSEAARFRSLQVILDKFAEGCTCPVIMIDVRGIIRSVNQETLLLFGYKRWEIIGQNIKILMPDNIARKHDQYLKRYEATKQRRTIMEKRERISGKRKDGSTMPISLRVQELDDLNGGSVYIGFIVDMSTHEQLQRVTDIFNAMLPASIRERLRAGEENIADHCEATVIFADVVGFTEFAANKNPHAVVEFLNRIFKVFDIVAHKYGVEKVKTIGDAWMGVCNATLPMYMDAPARVVETAVDMMRYMKLHEDLSLRIGIATGKVLAGCMSAETPNFDVFGHAVNLASRIQGLAPVGGILLDAATCDQTSHLYNFAGPTTLEVKGIGPVDTFVWSQKRNFTEQ